MERTKARTEWASQKAAEIIEGYGIRLPSEIDVETIAWDLGIDVQERTLSSSEAQLLRKGKFGTIRIRRGEKNTPRGRFSISHEIGHWCCHPNENQYWICTEDEIHKYKGSPMEVEANAFASELLLPATIFKPICQKGAFTIKHLESLAERFKCSLSATSIKLAEHFPAPCMVIVSGDGEVKWTARNGCISEFEYYVERESLISDYSLAACTFEHGDQSKEQVMTEAWFPNVRNPDDIRVFEETKLLRAFGLTISLITISN